MHQGLLLSDKSINNLGLLLSDKSINKREKITSCTKTVVKRPTLLNAQVYRF